MIVTHLNLSDFRNYHSAEVELVRGPNLFVGSNGQGKTNLVESLGFLSTLGSHRVSADYAMIRQGADAAIIRALLEHGERTILAEVKINRTGANRAQINRSVIKTKQLPRYFSSVLFAPEDLALVRGEPSVRRRFLDELLILLSPRYSGVMADYDRVLKQRNSLLKSARASGIKGTQLGTLEIWDDRLISLGAELIEARSSLVGRLLPYVRSAYETVAGEDHHANLLLYLTMIDQHAATDDAFVDGITSRLHQGASVVSIDEVESAVRLSLERLRRSELDRGMTLVGPHRDDLVLELNGMPARGYASHGESWSLALALKLASAELLRHDSVTGDPVLMLDDVFAELDLSRRTRLADAIHDFEQVLITAAVYEEVPRELTSHTVRIANGVILDSAATEEA